MVAFSSRRTTDASNEVSSLSPPASACVYLWVKRHLSGGGTIHKREREIHFQFYSKTKAKSYSICILDNRFLFQQLVVFQGDGILDTMEA